MPFQYQIGDEVIRRNDPTYETRTIESEWADADGNQFVIVNDWLHGSLTFPATDLALWKRPQPTPNTAATTTHIIPVRRVK